jgi:hypothetical protein
MGIVSRSPHWWQTNVTVGRDGDLVLCVVAVAAAAGGGPAVRTIG